MDAGDDCGMVDSSRFRGQVRVWVSTGRKLCISDCIWNLYPLLTERVSREEVEANGWRYGRLSKSE